MQTASRGSNYIIGGTAKLLTLWTSPLKLRNHPLDGAHGVLSGGRYPYYDAVAAALYAILSRAAASLEAASSDEVTRDHTRRHEMSRPRWVGQARGRVWPGMGGLEEAHLRAIGIRLVKLRLTDVR